MARAAPTRPPPLGRTGRGGQMGVKQNFWVLSGSPLAARGGAVVRPNARERSTDFRTASDSGAAAVPGAARRVARRRRARRLRSPPPPRGRAAARLLPWPASRRACRCRARARRAARTGRALAARPPPRRQAGAATRPPSCSPTGRAPWWRRQQRRARGCPRRRARACCPSCASPRRPRRGAWASPWCETPGRLTAGWCY